jgi:AraC-like DNA-binding protein
MEMLEATELNISEIAYDVGFNAPNYFSRAFSKEFGKTPIKYRK